MRLRLTSMTAGLAVGIIAAVGLATAAGAYLYSLHHFETLLESSRATALSQGQLMRSALEHQMMENDRSLIERMITTFGEEPQVETVLILDREGTARYSSRPVRAEDDLQIGSPTCQACHRLPPDQRESSQVIETRQGTLLRTVIPIRNREPCHACHDPAYRTNGILIVDMDADEIRAAMNRDLIWMVAGSVGLAVVLILAIVLIVRQVVLRRLQRFESTARQIAAGDLTTRVPVTGSDTIAWLGQEFNTMADAMAALLKDVQEQREQLETVINGIDDGIVVLDVDRAVVAVNDAFLRRTGQVREEILGSSCRDADVGTCGAGDCPTQACLISGQNQVRICERRLPDGRTVWEEVHASPIRRGSSGISHVVEVWRDISRRREAEARLAESHRLASLGLLASGFSHELNTPLGTILTCVEGILRSSEAGVGEQDARWTRVRDSARIAREQLLRCRGITQHFLGLSRGGKSPAALIRVEKIFSAVARLIEPTAREESVTIEVAPVKADLQIRINEAELQHVVLNLLLNGIQASGPGGHVKMWADGDDPVRIYVSDNGPGIAPEDHRRIFEPFFSRRDGGTGLGLFLSLDFVKRWKGEILVDSSPGSGSTFQIVLPAVGEASGLRIAQ